MQIHQVLVKNPAQLQAGLDALAAEFSTPPQLLLVFAAVDYFQLPDFAQHLTQAFPSACCMGCSTAGEIAEGEVQEQTCVLTAVQVEQMGLHPVAIRIDEMDDSFIAGQHLGKSLQGIPLKGVLVFGPGVAVNGSALIRGLVDQLGENIPISGGLAGDHGAFQATWTLANGEVHQRAVVALGLSGEKTLLQHGSMGGWEAFGPARKVTRCEGNVLYELDGEPALSVYKRYLGEYAKDLPASGLLFPFAMFNAERSSYNLIRTILGVSEADGSLILAGEIDPTGYLKLMHASTDKLVDGAEQAAESCIPSTENSGGLAILVSCIGRKLVMGARVDEEVEAVAEVFGQSTCLTGFYSNGEISPVDSQGRACLHNQTMTITWLNEQA